ncbi:uncharacterized protein MYCFIDRAFT_175870 [Pseudocercospora fijiensis CIRAD86]|uniref:Uncharacterized protein n=1 Tax=Pseudocercospora fijiensis (strain CIRAD86) TaxID=383855 RepID=M2YXA1_PSEFD|nr:uncharacterized protein MYCFIDRAFT_175870 [Pseudocercospora fijiensis CIRAD86]EME82330.1 hypothetical protein MYCFIDRAFT_175870 [Pseudocercospora fijiensis CIRAD86]
MRRATGDRKGANGLARFPRLPRPRSNFGTFIALHHSSSCLRCQRSLHAAGIPDENSSAPFSRSIPHQPWISSVKYRTTPGTLSEKLSCELTPILPNLPSSPSPCALSYIVHTIEQPALLQHSEYVWRRNKLHVNDLSAARAGDSHIGCGGGGGARHAGRHPSNLSYYETHSGWIGEQSGTHSLRQYFHNVQSLIGLLQLTYQRLPESARPSVRRTQQNHGKILCMCLTRPKCEEYLSRSWPFGEETRWYNGFLHLQAWSKTLLAKRHSQAQSTKRSHPCESSQPAQQFRVVVIISHLASILKSRHRKPRAGHTLESKLDTEILIFSSNTYAKDSIRYAQPVQGSLSQRLRHLDPILLKKEATTFNISKVIEGNLLWFPWDHQEMTLMSLNMILTMKRPAMIDRFHRSVSLISSNYKVGSCTKMSLIADLLYRTVLYGDLVIVRLSAVSTAGLTSLGERKVVLAIDLADRMPKWLVNSKFIGDQRRWNRPAISDRTPWKFSQLQTFFFQGTYQYHQLVLHELAGKWIGSKEMVEYVRINISDKVVQRRCGRD